MEDARELLQEHVNELRRSPSWMDRWGGWVARVDAYLRAHDAASVPGSDGRWEAKGTIVTEVATGWQFLCTEGPETAAEVAARHNAALASQAPATDALAEALLEWSSNHAGIFVWEQDSTEYLNDDEGWNSLLDLARAALGQQQEASS